MKQTIWSRILAFAVAMTMLLEILPMTSSAAADSFSSNTDTSSLAESMDNELSVVGEVSELRDATSKHFRLSDGSYAAVEYGIPIHFQTEDGAWTEIDNTLIYADDDGMYISENGIEERSFADTLYLGYPVFVTQQGDYQIEMSLMQQEEAVEEMASGDESVVEGTTDSINIENSVELEAMENLSLDNTGITYDGSNIPDQLKGEITTMSDATLSDNETEDAVTRIGISAIVINPSDGASVLSAENVEQSLTNQFLPDKLGSTVLYENVFDGVDLMYENYSYSIKETILVNEPQADYTYGFRLSTNGLTPILEEDGAVYLYDDADNPIFIIPAPYMYDASNVTSDAVEYSLESDGSDYILHIIADKTWINAPEREFPVAIDPTLLSYSFVYTDNNLYVTYVVQGDPNRPKATGDFHYIGYSTGTQSNTNAMTKECKMYVHLADFPDVPPGCTLVDASLQLYNVAYNKTGYSEINCPSLRLCAYPVTSEPESGSYVVSAQ